jgi:SOS-response transcriptional repressor LexA
MKPYPQSLPRQTAILQAIADHVKQYNQPPTLTEIGLACQMTKSHVRYHVRKLEAAGILTYRFNQRRTITLVQPKCPQCGQILVSQPYGNKCAFCGYLIQPAPDEHLEAAYEDRTGGVE